MPVSTLINADIVDEILIGECELGKLDQLEVVGLWDY
jgi:hypothetical protein